MIQVLTGGQTGVDTGALVAAEETSTRWRAVLPRGLRRECTTPDWMVRGGVHGRPAIVLRRASYAARTEHVMMHSHAILLISIGLTSPGTKLTHRLAEESGKPYRYHNPVADDREHTLGWLICRNESADACTLMVAGPRESRWTGAEESTRALMVWLLSSLRAASVRTPQPTS